MKKNEFKFDDLKLAGAEKEARMVPLCCRKNTSLKQW